MVLTEQHTKDSITMTTIDTPTAALGALRIPEVQRLAPSFELVAFDLYRDIHKGLRADLFAVSTAAGSVDPSDSCGRIALAHHITSLAAMLESHAHHEDQVIEPALVEHAPEIAERIAADHILLETRFAEIGEISDRFAVASADARRLGHLIYLELTAFTSAYLAHQIVEERIVMPVLERAIGVDAIAEMHVAILSSIPPEEMGRSLALMLPAMNIDDRTEMLAGMQLSAPPEAFAGTVSLARSVLDPTDFTSLAQRLQLA